MMLHVRFFHISKFKQKNNCFILFSKERQLQAIRESFTLIPQIERNVFIFFNLKEKNHGISPVEISVLSVFENACVQQLF